MAAMAAEVLVQPVAEIAQLTRLQILVAVVAEHLPDVPEMEQAVVPEL